MEKIERITSSDEKRFVDVVRQDDGSYSLQRSIRMFDSEEDSEYIVRELPDPVGRFADLSSAIDEAERLVGGSLSGAGIMKTIEDGELDR